MSKLAFAVLACAFAVLAVGCGGGDDEASEAKVGNPSSLLVSSADLPEASATGQSPPEVCGPIPVMQEGGGKAAISKTFVVGETRVIEAVGVFSTPAKARSAYDALNSRKRLGCIGGAIESFGPASSVEIIRSQPLDFGDEASAVRYVGLNDNSKPEGYSDAVALRVGRCAAALLIAVERDEPPDAVAEESTETAADRLSAPCG
jgi:hypothetical protein